MPKLTIFAAVLMVSACSQTTFNSETSRVICNAWERTVFLPSRNDTQETIEGVTLARKTQAVTCEGIQ